VELRSLRCYAVELPLAHGTYSMSDGRRHDGLTTTVVEVEYEDGMAGYGEACTLGSNYIDGFAASVRAGVAELADVALSSDPFRPDVLLERMDSAVRGHAAAKAAIDAALLDLRGKLLALPVCDLLGGRHQRTYPIFHPLTLSEPEAMAAEADDFAHTGYRCWQLKLGDDPLEDARRSAAVLEALADRCTFMSADANRGWTVADALRYVRAVDGLDLYLEQPCETLEELRSVHARARVPMIADEVICVAADLVRCLELGCAEAVNIKPARVGGLTRAARLRDLAQDMGMMIVVDEPMGGVLATAGIAHLAASSRPDSFLAAFHPTAELVSTAGSGAVGGPVIDAGYAAAPEYPGLGVEVDVGTLGTPAFVVERGASR
jgi:L-alanine-DL-glutamate epimerase-like enolase superfamily enzyme